MIAPPVFCGDADLSFRLFNFREEIVKLNLELELNYKNVMSVANEFDGLGIA